MEALESLWQCGTSTTSGPPEELAVPAVQSPLYEPRLVTQVTPIQLVVEIEQLILGLL